MSGGTGGHPRHGLDTLIHTPVRLSVMSALAEADHVEFRFLRDSIEVSDSLLAKHLGTLEEAGYITSVKGHVLRRPRTWFSLTSTGRAAFDSYLASLRRIVDHDVEEEQS
ncbi:MULTISPECIES: transcriptional regulator [unclassified Actinopolyspora]|uniref:winged helix-turn-helix domain-containing protein n=1 Tax=unclassified Actinopolyspora TaxID=2639451 RepID=UPI0013F65A48|nr:MULTISPECIES: transcriptional regulator [unclassified Actinopolyspora]NHD18344.1 transcriptional regulator [Actinopolyspora sp. BKK2]NHE76977.1 transcriptional regulator [Actinopolyspora sp. BKK1]